MKTLIKALFALALLAILVLYLVTEPPTLVVAETRVQMQQRTIAGYIDKYDLNTTCDESCVQTRENENPWLIPLARQLGFEHGTLTRASIGHSIDWGFSFEKLYGRPPTMDDWVTSWTAINEDFRYELGATPQLYAVDRWSDERYYRHKLEFGGLY